MEVTSVSIEPVLAAVQVPDTLPTGSYRQLLRNRSFLALWVSQVLSQLSDRVVFVVFIAMLVHYFGTQDSLVNNLYIAFTLPAILLTAVAGVFIDRWNRKALLLGTNVARGLLLLLLPWAAANGLMQTYALAVALSAVTQFFIPAEAATIPLLVPKNQLLKANSLFTTTMMASVIFGFALGDPLIHWFSLHAVHWAMSSLFFAAATAIFFVKMPHCGKYAQKQVAEQESLGEALHESVDDFWQELCQGWIYLREHASVFRAILKLALLFSTVVAVCLLSVGFARLYLFNDPEQAARKFAYLVTASGLGMALGALWVGRYGDAQCRHRMIFGGFLMMGLAFVGLALTPWLTQPIHSLSTLLWRHGYAYSVSFVAGVAMAFVAIPLQAIIHEEVAEAVRGKITGIQFTLLSTTSALPAVLFSFLLPVIGVQGAFYGVAAPLLLVGSLGLFRLCR